MTEQLPLFEPARRRGGRAKTPKHERSRPHMLSVRISEAERAALQAKADHAQISLASFARAALLGAPLPRQARKVTVEVEALSRTLGALGPVGSNLNQLTRAANMGAAVNADALAATLADLREARDAIMTALGRDP